MTVCWPLLDAPVPAPSAAGPSVLAFFWAFFDRALFPMDGVWPPEGITTFDPFDGTVIATMLDDTTASAGSFLSGNYDAESFGDFPVIPGEAAGNVDFNFGIALRFDVSAGDTAAFTSSMVVAVPAPGGPPCPNSSPCAHHGIQQARLPGRGRQVRPPAAHLGKRRAGTR